MEAGAAASPVSETRTTPPATSPVTTVYPQRATAYQSYYNRVGTRSVEVDRTKDGLLFLIAGALLGLIPVIGIIGGLISLIGAILIILGRAPFGSRHSTAVGLSVALFIVGIAIAGIFTLGLASDVASIARYSTSVGTATDAITSAFNDFLYGVLISGAVTGLSNVLISYMLQKSKGKIILWSSYAASVIILSFVLYYIGSQLPSAIQAAFASGTYNSAPIQGLQSQETLLALLGVIPTLGYVYAYQLVRLRIERGEIPSRDSAS